MLLLLSAPRIGQYGLFSYVRTGCAALYIFFSGPHSMHQMSMDFDLHIFMGQYYYQGQYKGCKLVPGLLLPHATYPRQPFATESPL